MYYSSLIAAHGSIVHKIIYLFQWNGRFIGIEWRMFSLLRLERMKRKLASSPKQKCVYWITMLSSECFSAFHPFPLWESLKAFGHSNEFTSHRRVSVGHLRCKQHQSRVMRSGKRLLELSNSQRFNIVISPHEVWREFKSFVAFVPTSIYLQDNQITWQSTPEEFH